MLRKGVLLGVAGFALLAVSCVSARCAMSGEQTVPVEMDDGGGFVARFLKGKE
jgi:hypothetical protein